VTEEEFAGDLIANLNELQGFGVEALRFRRYLLPPYEHFNREIADWTRARRWSLINYTPGTRSHADYTGEADKNFTSSQAIFESIVKRDKEDPCGLNGFLLLLHVGSGPGREDKFHTRFGELLDYLAQREYEFVGVDDLLEPAREELP
jgi:endoglucanase